MRPQPWRVRSSRVVLDEPWYRVRVETVELPDGTVVDDYFVAERSDFALVAAITPEEELVLVRQWKQGIRAITLELPGGIVDAGEDVAAAAARELREETGYACDELRLLGAGPLDPSKETNRVHLFAGSGARQVAEQELEPTEQIETVLVPVGELRGLIAAGELDAPISIAGIYLALDAFGRL